MSRHAYEQLKTVFERVSRLRGIVGVLQWDAATVMPAAAENARAMQLETLETAIAETLSAPRLTDWLNEAETGDQGPWDKANLREMRREIAHAASVPAAISGRLAAAGSRSEAIWRTAKEANDFAAVAPALAEVVALTREVAAAKSDALGCTAHDALIDRWEPAMRHTTVAPLFDRLAKTLPAIIEAVRDRQGETPPPLNPVPVHKQKAACHKLAERLGYDFSHGRIDESAQAFFMDDSPEDVRITTTYQETDYRKGVFGVAHEVGHSFYERAIPQDWRYQPVGRPRSAALQESQALLIEKIVVRSQSFITTLAPELRACFGVSGAAWDAKTLTRQLRWMSPGSERVNAHETIYPLHIVMRHHLEKDLIEGNLDPRDLPEAWNAAYKGLLGTVPDTDREGCLQDIHWYRGLFGYFQSYLLGAMLAAQFFDAAKSADTTVAPALDEANVTPLKMWLEKNVYGFGSLLTTEELVKSATGRGLTPDPYLIHLRRRYVGDT